MKSNSKILLLALSIAPTTVLISSFTQSTLFILNSLFYAGLALLMIGGSLILIEGGFFNAFIRNSMKFFSSVSKKEMVIQEVEQRTGTTARIYKNKFPQSKLLLLIGLSYCVFSIIGSVLYIYLGK